MGSDVRLWKEFLGTESDDAVPVLAQQTFGALLAVSTAQGLSGARDAAENNPPPSRDGWADLYKNDNYTMLPPALVNSVPCNPPITNRQLFLGAFSAVLALGSATAMAVIAVMPLVLLSAFFYVLGSIIIVGASENSGHEHRRRHGERGETRLAVAMYTLGAKAAATIPSMFTSRFVPTAHKVYRKLWPADQPKSCKRGLLFVSNSPPICISDMDTHEAKRYTCPADKSRSLVVSCEAEFDGLVAIRGEAC